MGEVRMSKKIVINNCFGGFGLSEEAREMLGRPLDSYDWEVRRDDPKLVEVVEKLGCGSYGRHAKLKIIEIPEDIEWELSDYDGIETVHEQHRKWG